MCLNMGSLANFSRHYNQYNVGTMSLCKFTSYYRYYLHTAQQKEFVGLLVRFSLELSYGNCFRSRLCPLTSFTRYLLQFRSLQSSMPSTFQFDLMPFNAIPQAEDEHQNIFYVQAYLHIHTYIHTYNHTIIRFNGLCKEQMAPVGSHSLTSCLAFFSVDY